jgi:hypothetical protein
MTTAMRPARDSAQRRFAGRSARVKLAGVAGSAGAALVLLWCYHRLS